MEFNDLRDGVYGFELAVFQRALLAHGFRREPKEDAVWGSRAGKFNYAGPLIRNLLRCMAIELPMLAAWSTNGSNDAPHV